MKEAARSALLRPFLAALSLCSQSSATRLIPGLCYHECMPDPQKDLDQKGPVEEEVIMIPHERGATAIYRRKRHLMMSNFLGGIAWGFGGVIGATLVVALVLFILNWLDGLPWIGSFVSDILDTISNPPQ